MLSDSDKELIHKYLCGDLPEKERYILKQRIESDPELKEYMSTSQRVWSVLDLVEEKTPTPHYIEKFWDRVKRKRGKGIERLLQYVRELNKKWLFVGSFATLFVITVLIFNSFHSPSDQAGRVPVSSRTSDKKDQSLYLTLEKVSSEDLEAILELYGPWEELD